MLEKISLLLLDLWWRIPEATSQPSWRASPMQFAGRHGESGGRSWRGADRAMACGSCGTLWIPLINYHRYGIDGQFSMFLAIENGDLFQFAMLVYQMVNPTNQPCPIIIVLVCEMFFFHFFPRFLRLFFVHSSLFWLMILSTVVNFILISFWIPQDWHMKTPTEMWTVLGNPTDFIEVPYLCWFTGG